VGAHRRDRPAHLLGPRAGGVGEQRGEPLHPPVHRHAVDCDIPRSASSSSRSR
jgi:hypothetical protein